MGGKTTQKLLGKKSDFTDERNKKKLRVGTVNSPH